MSNIIPFHIFNTCGKDKFDFKFLNQLSNYNKVKLIEIIFEYCLPQFGPIILLILSFININDDIINIEIINIFINDEIELLELLNKNNYITYSPNNTLHVDRNLSLILFTQVLKIEHLIFIEHDPKIKDIIIITKKFINLKIISFTAYNFFAIPSLLNSILYYNKFIEIIYIKTNIPIGDFTLFKKIKNFLEYYEKISKFIDVYINEEFYSFSKLKNELYPDEYTEVDFYEEIDFENNLEYDSFDDHY